MTTTPTIIPPMQLETTSTALVVNVGPGFESRAERIFGALVDLSKRYIEFMNARPGFDVDYRVADLAHGALENVDFYEGDPADIVAELHDTVIIYLGDPTAFGDEAGAWFAAIVELAVRYAQLTVTMMGEVGWDEVRSVHLQRSVRHTFMSVAENLED